MTRTSIRSLVRTGLIMVALLAPIVARADDRLPPTLDCAMTYDGARAYTAALQGATTTTGLAGFDLVSVGREDAWQADFMFTLPGHSAHPAVVLRTRRKQVTGVWTAESKGCGYGDQAQFVALMADTKAEDSKLTNASRDDVEKLKQSQSPLSPPP